MTDRRLTPDPGAEQDAIVSEAYRDAAAERAPEHLNRAVLDAAEKEARPQYSRLRTWTRPVAWAAVVMLSVAILFETNQAPLPQSAAPMAEKRSADEPVANDQLKDQDSEPNRDLASPQIETEADVAERKLESQLMKSDLSSSVQQQPAAAQELRVRDDEILERAEDMARMQQGADEAALASFEEVAPGCDETARAEPESWLECIVELEQAGSLDIARHERELLAEDFPDFEAR